jgi:hypothetical protein
MHLANGLKAFFVREALLKYYWYSTAQEPLLQETVTVVQHILSYVC